MGKIAVDELKGKILVDKEFLFKIARRGDENNQQIKKHTALIEELYCLLQDTRPVDFEVQFDTTVLDINKSGEEFQRNFKVLCKNFGIIKANIKYIN